VKGATIETTVGHTTGELLRQVIDLISEKKGEQTLILDMRDFSIPTDFFVITAGDNAKHVKAIADHLVEKFPAALHRSEGWDSKNWIVLDYGDLIIHVFQRELRRFYDLEGLWGDKEIRFDGETPGELAPA
jgi:ribosome-associated protein